MDFHLFNFLSSDHFYCFSIFFSWKSNPQSSLLQLCSMEVPSIWLRFFSGDTFCTQVLPDFSLWWPHHYNCPTLWTNAPGMCRSLSLGGTFLLSIHHCGCPRGWAPLRRVGKDEGCSGHSALLPAPAPSASALWDPLGRSPVLTVSFSVRGCAALGYPMATASLRGKVLCVLFDEEI